MLPELNDTAILWLAPMRKTSFIIYYLVVGLFVSGFLSLFFIRFIFLCVHPVLSGLQMKEQK
jgi:hypothetical protein